VLTIGFDAVEYDPALWNRGKDRKLVHVDCMPADPDRDYRPQIELLGDIAATLTAQRSSRAPTTSGAEALPAEIAGERPQLAAESARRAGMPAHPLRLVHVLQGLLDEDTTSAPTWAPSTSGWRAT